jgi:putative isomerase
VRRYMPLVEHFEAHGRSALRPAEGILRHPYIVPGAAYSRQLWDWDSYWFARGMLALGRLRESAEVIEHVARHGAGSVLNLLDHQGPDGTVPIMVTADDADVFGCLRRDGLERNQAKPVLAQFALLVSRALGDTCWLAASWPRLVAFLDRWQSHYASSTGLLVWGSDVAIGVDNDPTSCGRPPFSSANLLLNCLYHQDLLAAAELARALQQAQDAARFECRAGALGEAIRRHCWDPVDEFFYTVDVQCTDRRLELMPEIAPGMPMRWSSLPLKVKSFTGLLPSAYGIATDEQAQAMRGHACDPCTLRARWGVRSLSRKEPMYSEEASGNPSNWLGPVWTLCSFVGWQALRRYGHAGDANALARDCCDLLLADLTETGTLHEYYVPDSGRPVMNPGFSSWNALCLEMIEAMA